MPKVFISTGKSRFETSWKNQELLWDTLLEKLRKPKVTAETYAQYKAMSKEKQGDIKDIGGFVGGTISGGNRVIGSVASRSLVTLDIDYADADFWTNLTLEFDCELMIYSTHKHHPTEPRYRLVLPLNREVHSDEYEAIARKIAEKLGIDLFDPTTFQPERLMYWPSTPCDGAYVYQVQKGEWLDADWILSMYGDWRDSSEWCYNESVKRKVLEGIDKQEDPSKKSGIIGVFCRVYGVSAAIDKYLDKVYESCKDGRYTYKAGSTHAGMVVYDDLFAFSHHSTDPTSSRLCNAFDLVRIHLFGQLDKNVKEGTPSSKRPSFVKMSELISDDPLIKEAIVIENMDNAKKKEFVVGKLMKERERDADWAKLLDMDRKGGSILNTINNTVIVLSHDPALKDNLCFDDLSKRTLLRKDLPWRKVSSMNSDWTDADDASLRNYLEIMYGITNRNSITDAVMVVVHQNSFHPVREYLSSLKWDGKERVETMLVKYLGVQDNPYTRAVTRKTLVAAVARVYEPGIKFDNVLTIKGPQGVGKSRLIAKLGMGWFSDTFGSLKNKDAMENIQGVWIMEIGEGAGLKNQDLDAVKLFMSKQTDRFRISWGKNVQSYPRQCIFIITTNEDNPLKDHTGGRRFWVVVTGNDKYPIPTQKEIDQIWAEACYMYTMGEDIYLDDEMESVAREVQDENTERDERADTIIKYLMLKIPDPEKWYAMDIYARQGYVSSDGNLEDETQPKGEYLREHITVPEIWCELFKGKLQDMTNYNTKFIRQTMNRLREWQSKLVNKKPYGYQRGWVRGSMVTSQKTIQR